MKRCPCLIATLALFAFSITLANAAESLCQPGGRDAVTNTQEVSIPIQIGDSIEHVIAHLGKPRGYIGSERYRILYFHQGEVVVRDGIVVSYTLVPIEEADRRREERRLARERHRAAREREVEERIAEGQEELDRRLADPAFHALPASARLAYFEAFRRRYPEIDIGLPHSITIEEVRIERQQRLAEVEREQRLLELEQRVRESERRAAIAESEARRSLDETRLIHRPLTLFPVIIRDPCPTTLEPRPDCTRERRTIIRIERRSPGDGDTAPSPSVAGSGAATMLGHGAPTSARDMLR